MFIFDAPVGARVLSYGFIGATCLDDGEFLWWDGKEWTTTPSVDREISTHNDIRSFKAFKRHVRQHGHSLKGRTITLVSRYIGHDITWKG